MQAVYKIVREGRKKLIKIKELGKFFVRLASNVFRLAPLKKDKIFLMNFDGTIIGHDAKAIVDYCRKKGIAADFVWGAKDEEYAARMKYPGVRFVALNSARGWYDMLTAKTLIYNINPPSYLSFRKAQILVNTWHGFNYKAVGKYIDGFDKRQFNTTTCFLSDARLFTRDTIRDSFEYEGEVLECGTPRTDIFYSKNRDEAYRKVRRGLGLPDDVRLVLYTPTFRGDFMYRDSAMDSERLKKALEKRFGGRWEVLYKLHPMIAKKFKADEGGVIDVSSYEDTQELACAADVLVTDYSSISWEFSLMRRPVFLYTDDIAEYDASRTFSIPVERWPFPIALDNDELEKNILAFDVKEYTGNILAFQEEEGCLDLGHACEEALKYIAMHGGKLNRSIK